MALAALEVLAGGVGGGGGGVGVGGGGGSAEGGRVPCPSPPGSQD